MPRFPADSAQVNTDSSQPSQYRFGPFTIDATRQVLLREGERVSLSAKSFDTLLALVRRYGATVSKSELLEAVWGEAVVEENSLNKCISEVRKALGDQRGRHDYIVTITGVGYRFVAPVSQALEPPGAAEAPRELKSALLFWSAAATAVLAAGALYLGLHHATPQR
ncbi:MAG: transcriptional regulator, partial [Acidobacteriia bacterium]|nr:transcriptional regulator [Terriglobia bacterium]